MKPPDLFYFGSGSILVSALTFWAHRRSAKRLDTILETPTIACKDIPGLGASTVEVVGVDRAASPLTSDLTATPCVAFSCSVTEHWTTTETETDEKGNTRTVTRSHSAQRYSNSARTPFEVVDATGSVRVDPDGAAIDLIAQAAGPAPPGSPAFGLCPLHFGGYLMYSEAALPVGVPVYVLASVSADHTLIKPPTLDDPFIISYHSEEDLIRSARWAKRIWGALALLVFLGGMGLLGYWYDVAEARFPWQ